MGEVPVNNSERVRERDLEDRRGSQGRWLQYVCRAAGGGGAAAACQGRQRGRPRLG
jgi:hypothetical protein